MATISLKVSDEERKRWQEAAGGKGLSAWIKMVCNAHCDSCDDPPIETPVKLTKRPDGDYQAPAKAVMPTGPISVGLASEKPPMEDIGGFKIPKDIVKSRAERLGLDKKPKGGAELFGHMLPQEE